MGHVATASLQVVSSLSCTGCSADTAAPLRALQGLHSVLIFLQFSNLTLLAHVSYFRKDLVLGRRSKELDKQQSESHNFIKVFQLTAHC